MDPYAPDNEQPSLTPWIVAAVLVSVLILLRPVLTVMNGDLGSPEAAGEAVGMMVGTLLVPALVAGLFALAPRFRNARSALQVYTWTSLVAFVGQLMSSVPTAP